MDHRRVDAGPVGSPGRGASYSLSMHGGADQANQTTGRLSPARSDRPGSQALARSRPAGVPAGSHQASGRIGHTSVIGFVTSSGGMMRRGCAAAALTVAVTLGAAGSAPAATKWLCGPGVARDPCRPSLSTTFYRGWDARTGRSTPRRASDRGPACFYVYPTVSNQRGRLATKRVDPELRSIALYQAARFSQLCRVYAPVYRQATVPALQAGTAAPPAPPPAPRGVRRAPPSSPPPPRP